MFDVLQRDVPEQLVVIEQRNLRAKEVAGWLRAAMGRLEETAQAYGGVAGSWFVVCYEQVSEDTEVPVEVCAPISPGHEGSTAAAMRREPAHREAYVRLTKAQVEFPHIQSAYASPISFRPPRLTRCVTSPSRFADPLLSIGVFARRSRLSMKALRLYDRLGLLTPADVDPDNGYRRYRESQLVTARLVVMLRRLDMPLAHVAEIVSAPGPLGVERLTSYWEAFERRVAGQRELVAHIRSRLSGGEGSLGLCEVSQRQVPAQLVLTEQRHVQVEQLPSWIGAAMGRLMKSARRYGGVAGNPFVVYYGEVNEDSDGPAEACVPIDLAQEGSVDAAIRREPAHREAYVRLRKAQVAFPQILSAYDGVIGWVASQGLAVAGSPREVYFTDFVSAGPGDEVCDVALPIE